METSQLNHHTHIISDMPDPVIDYFTPAEFLSAAETGARGELTMAALETRLIVAATRHADNLGVGYEDLLTDGNAWVLSRMSIEMDRMPRIHDTFSIVTWVENFNRHLSERNFSVLDADGVAMGHARSVWSCINIASRRPASLWLEGDVTSPRPCPIATQPRMRPVTDPQREVRYRFTYSDIDFNRHVNSARYVELISNCFPLEMFDSHRMRRLDIAYLHEAPYGSEALVRIERESAGSLTYRIDIDDAASPGATRCRARVEFIEAPSSGFMTRI